MEKQEPHHNEEETKERLEKSPLKLFFGDPDPDLNLNSTRSTKVFKFNSKIQEDFFNSKKDFSFYQGR